MRRFVPGVTAAALAACALVTAQTSTPFKLGTFELRGRTFVGIVLRDTVVIDLAAANAAIQAPASSVAAPADMKDLIARYDAGVRTRIGQIVSFVEGASTGARPAYILDRKDLKTLPPVMYPMTMLNVAVNYREHDAEMSRGARGASPAAAPPPGTAPPGTESAPGIWQRAAGDARWNP